MTLTLSISKSVYGGAGLARLGDGRVAFVEGAFPGETVRAKITEEKRRFVRCEIVEMLEPSPERILAFGEAVQPGAVYSAVSPKAELAFKRDQLENFLQKVSKKDSEIKTTAHTGWPLDHYRNKAIYRFKRDSTGAWLIGYLREGSHDVIDTPQDALALPEINVRLPSIRSDVKAILTQGADAVRKWAAATETVTVRYTRQDGVKWWLGAAPKDMVLRETTCGLTFKVAADGFYQVNPAVGEELVKRVVAAYLEKADALPHILDLYCGVGVFGICCAKANKNPPEPVRLVGAEMSQPAIRLAKENAAAAGVDGRFFAEKVGGSVRRFKVGSKHTVIVDPPRGGLERQAAEWLSKCRAGRIFYVSCDPATLVRDLSIIMQGWQWKVERAELFNMFPRTARFESFIILERR
ncbi:MAG: class I SAM-dependent RNA methyltransferase [Kiritimatiellae bacterium]|nr:class I SAM-dependent RNA methyltransferase [Kiritimatiellia bacterium]